MEYFDNADPQRVVRSYRVKPGGIFTSGEMEVQYQDVKYEWVDKAKKIIICNACQGEGKKTSPYGGTMGCRFCDGKGTLKLKNPTREV